jgi:phosphoribosylanthranilate isomerase
MIANPKFITFTGADEKTDLFGMVELGVLYPIEWAFLLSPKRQGKGRYPALEFVKTAIDTLDRIAIHICGDYSKQLIESGKTDIDDLLRSAALRSLVRVQINTAHKDFPLAEIEKWAMSIGAVPILQCRKEFPEQLTGSGFIDWLFDASGGRGISPESWPKPASQRLCGYAGGLSPSNAAQAVETIGSMSSNYWIDMETGVRDENDNFSLERCLRVCEAVYGKADEF